MEKYRLIKDQQNFTLEIIDNTSNSSYNACFNHYKTVDEIPEYKVYEKSNPANDSNIPIHLTFSIGMVPYDNKTYDFGYSCDECPGKEVFPGKNTFNITNLPYAFYNYNITFKLRLKGSEHWKNITKIIQTKPRKPKIAPNQRHFLFYEENGHLVISWKKPETRFHDGPNFYLNLTYGNESTKTEK